MKKIKKEFIAYKGSEYTIEWFFNDKEKSEAQAYFESLSTDRKKKCFYLVTNAYEKKSAKMPPKEKDRALKAKENYITRVKKGTYYD